MKKWTYKPSKRCSIYIKKMISRENWSINNKITSTKDIASHLNISISTVYNVLKTFEQSGILENNGKLGYYLISPTKKLLSKNQQYNKFFQNNLAASIFLNEGAKHYNEWLIKVKSNDINVFNIITGITYTTTILEVFNIIHKPISLNNILDLKGNEFKSAKLKFNRQKELLPVAKIITNNKKELIC